VVPPTTKLIRRNPIALLVTAMAIVGGVIAAPPDRHTGAAPPSCRVVRPVLSYGQENADVLCLERALQSAGYQHGYVDGRYLSTTVDAVNALKRANGLPADGVVRRWEMRRLGIAGQRRCRPTISLPAGARQLVVVTAEGTYANVDLLVKRGGRWVCSGRVMAGRVGRNGLRFLARRHAGDGTTPAGRFPLYTETAPGGQRFAFFGNGPDPGVHGRWRQVRHGDCWDASGGDPAYNRLTRRAAGSCRSPDEYLPDYQGAYSAAALIGANMGPSRSGDEPGEVPRAAAIFLHRHSYEGGWTRPTAGCVSLGANPLAYVLRRLVPGRAHFHIHR
jgi:L,D-peptidoglycan transpeptidase YkuD (ErfK/YbiS/YcfS/YnhG family)